MPLPPNVVPFPAGNMPRISSDDAARMVRLEINPKPIYEDDCARMLAIGRLIDEIKNDQIRGSLRAGWREGGFALFSFPLGMNQGGDDE